MTKELLMEIMARSRHKNKYLIDKTDENRFLYTQQKKNCCPFKEHSKELLSEFRREGRSR